MADAGTLRAFPAVRRLVRGARVRAWQALSSTRPPVAGNHNRQPVTRLIRDPATRPTREPATRPTREPATRPGKIRWPAARPGQGGGPPSGPAGTAGRSAPA